MNWAGCGRLVACLMLACVAIVLLYVVAPREKTFMLAPVRSGHLEPFGFGHSVKGKEFG